MVAVIHEHQAGGDLRDDLNLQSMGDAGAVLGNGISNIAQTENLRWAVHGVWDGQYQVRAVGNTTFTADEQVHFQERVDFRQRGLMQRTIKISLTLFCAAMCAGCTMLDTPIFVPLPKLIENPGQFDGRRIVTRGFVESRNEKYRIWTHRIDAAQAAPEMACVNLGFPETMETLNYNERTLDVEGTFVAKVDPALIILGSCLNRHMIQVEAEKPPRDKGTRAH